MSHEQAPEVMIYGSFFRGKDVQPSTSKWLLSRGVNVVIAAASLAHVSSRCIAYIRMILHMVHFNWDHVHSLGNNTAYLRTTLHMFYIRQHMCTACKSQMRPLGTLATYMVKVEHMTYKIHKISWICTSCNISVFKLLQTRLYQALQYTQQWSL